MRSNRRGTHSAVTLALAGLLSSVPVHAAEAPAVERIESLSEVVTALDESLPVADPVAAEEKVWKAVGQGTASYYGRELAGNRTASGERFNPNGLTAAHRTLPLGTKLRVTNVANGRSVIVRVNDRGPFVGKRLIDVSLGAAREIEMVRSGTAQVRLELVPTT
ncbi:MAG TPA: septal ring lytic transglycosylase RlpA family protein [Allosphingosinicella sp.]|nr:septal ring lytic transglycosylase RlpA family protein [Allosphingosinicella sp.]